MPQTELPLYPKISSIYNKIMQLGIAIVIIVVLLNILLANSDKSNQTVRQHFNAVGQQVAAQSAIAAGVFLQSNELAALKTYIEQLNQAPTIKDVHLYDSNGQLIASSVDAKSINELYGNAINALDRSEHYLPFITEIHHDKFSGYLRVTLDKALITEALYRQNSELQQWSRLMLIMAGIVGFLLTRGLNRFSRQGFRLARSSN